MGAEMSDDTDTGTSVAEQHPLMPDRTTLSFANTDGSQLNTVRIPVIPVAGWRLNTPGFAFDSSLVAPAFRDEIARLQKIVDANPGCPAALFGHCDPVGSDELNKTLGDRRVIAIYALFTRQPDLWADIYDNPAVGDTWGTRSLQSMLTSLVDGDGNAYYAGAIDGIYGSGATAAVKHFQPDSGLPATGQADATTRKVLFAAYMDWLCSSFRMEPGDFLGGTAAQSGDLPKMSLQGCSEFNPVVLLPASEMFFFKKGTSVDPDVWPCPKAKEPLAGSLRWGFQPESGCEPDLLFGLEMFLTHDGLARDDEARQKLNNLGYPKENDLADSVSGFQLIRRTPMVEIRRLNPNPRVKVYAKLEGFPDRGEKYLSTDFFGL
jgi:hypothetical protein